MKAYLQGLRKPPGGFLWEYGLFEAYSDLTNGLCELCRGLNLWPLGASRGFTVVLSAAPEVFTMGLC